MGQIIIDLLSDTHNQHRSFKPEGGDILIHAGDVCGRGTYQEAIEFLDWYADQDYSHLVMIAGNHDFIFEEEPKLMAKECKDRNIILLNDSGIVIEGIKIWGSPVQPWFHDWAFNRQRGNDIKKHWDLIPLDTEILVTHGPPYGYGDKVSYSGFGMDPHVGCFDLLKQIEASEVKLHVSGHIHEGRGVEIRGDGKIFANVSSLDRRYYPAAKKPMRFTREIIQDGSILYLHE